MKAEGTLFCGVNIGLEAADDVAVDEAEAGARPCEPSFYKTWLMTTSSLRLIQMLSSERIPDAMIWMMSRFYKKLYDGANVDGTAWLASCTRSYRPGEGVLSFLDLD